MKPEFKIEGDNVIVTADLSTGIDTDKDGEFAVKVLAQFRVEADASEMVDELVKSSKFVETVKAKLEKLGL